jgi:hypothetical protein
MLEKNAPAPAAETKKTPTDQAVERKKYSVKEAMAASRRALDRLRESMVDRMEDAMKEAMEKYGLAPDHSFVVFTTAMKQPTPKNVAEAQKILRNGGKQVSVDGIL